MLSNVSDRSHPQPVSLIEQLLLHSYNCIVNSSFIAQSSIYVWRPFKQTWTTARKIAVFISPISFALLKLSFVSEAPPFCRRNGIWRLKRVEFTLLSMVSHLAHEQNPNCIINPPFFRINSATERIVRMPQQEKGVLLISTIKSNSCWRDRERKPPPKGLNRI